MIGGSTHVGFRGRLLLACILTVVSVAFGAGSLPAPGVTALEHEPAPTRLEVAAGTPVADADEPDQRAPSAADPLDGDPLDGDPPDDARSHKDTSAPDDDTRIEIIRSGRPTEEPLSLPAYDDDPETIWTPDAGSEETWLWFDLGDERRVREVRWLARGTGAVDVAVSSDRRRWRRVDRVDVDDAWQGMNLRDDARYIRISLLADTGELPSLAEVTVYGDERESISAEQETAGSDRERGRNRAGRDEGGSRGRRNARNGDAVGRSGNTSDETRANRPARISAEAGEARCTGNRERCQARRGEASIDAGCERDGSCTIDVRVDGGTAICDAAGGDRSRAGGGEGRRASDGGRCEAEADGGAVAIGDIEP